MAYIRPEDVLSPRINVRGVVEVIHDPGEGEMSVARVLWKKEGKEEEEVIATRWNGSGERPLGNPVSRGHATWFVVDKLRSRQRRAGRTGRRPNGRRLV